ncbi:hypothetical protein ASG85_36345 [Paenibacillus sp. Soil724D2]|nr:hypothetical protein ASG85_36345 [Paenibacillus sp. Soil724D2]
MKVILIVVLFVLLASRDVPGMRNKKYRKDMLIYSFLMMAGMTLSFLAVFHLYLPIWPRG